MKVCNILGFGLIIASLTITSCSLAKKNVASLGQKYKIKTKQSLIIDINEQETEKHEYVYIIEDINIHIHIGTENVIFLQPNTKLERIKNNIIEGWDVVLIEDNEYCILSEFLTTEEPAEVAESIENQIKDSKISQEDLRYMSAIIYAEAGNQCEAGQQAVGIVVMNRVKSELYENTIYDVIYESGQFTPVNNGSLETALLLYDRGELPDEIIKSAKYALRGNTTVYYNNITYDLDGYLYFSRYISDCRLQIQDHMFK